MSATDPQARASRPGRVQGRRIVVTGAAAGIGLAATRLLVEEGARVAMLDRDGRALTEAARSMGVSARAFMADVTDEEQVRAAMAGAAAFLGGIDGVVNAAGVARQSEFGKLTLADWRATMAVNLDGPFIVCQAALPHLMKAPHGTIVNISSGVALRPINQSTAYAASKGGLITFGKALAVELAPHDIRVNTICPGTIETSMIRRRLDRAIDPEAELERLLERRLLKRFGQPEEIAHAVLFLTSQDCGYVTGSVMAIDGGGAMY